MKELPETIHDKQVIILGARVVLSVFIGIILPQVSTSRVRNRPSDIMILFIWSSLSRLLILSIDSVSCPLDKKNQESR